MRTIRILLLLLLLPSTAAALGYDARGMAMGGTNPGQATGPTARLNPALQAVPPRHGDGRWALPVPIGLVQAVRDFPVTDPDDPDFSAVAILQYAANVPWAWEFNRPDDPTEGAEITVGRNQLVIDLKDGQDVIPEDGWSQGTLGEFFDLGLSLPLGRGAGSRGAVLRVSLLRPFYHSQVEVGMDEALARILGQAAPVQPGGDYHLAARSLLQAGFTSGLGLAVPLFVEGAGGTDGEGGGLWAGIAWRHYFGAGYVRLDGDGALTAADPIFSSTGPDTFDVDFEGRYERAWAEDFSSLGHGDALDLGAVWRRGPLQVGAGVADLFADLSWSNTHLDRTYYDEAFDEVITEVVDAGYESTTEIPVSWYLQGSWEARRWAAAAEVLHEPGGTSYHGGGEYWTLPWLALRGGLEVDQRDRLQVGGGVGLRWGGWGLDVGLQTHNRNLSRERGLSLGLALAFY